MRKKILAFVFGAGLLMAIAVPMFSGGDSAYAGCKDFGQATAAGAPWGADTKAQNEAGPPGVIADNVAGAKAALCS